MPKTDNRIIDVKLQNLQEIKATDPLIYTVTDPNHLPLSPEYVNFAEINRLDQYEPAEFPVMKQRQDETLTETAKKIIDGDKNNEIYKSLSLKTLQSRLVELKVNADTKADNEGKSTVLFLATTFFSGRLMPEDITDTNEADIKDLFAPLFIYPAQLTQDRSTASITIETIGERRLNTKLFDFLKIEVPDELEDASIDDVKQFIIENIDGIDSAAFTNTNYIGLYDLASTVLYSDCKKIIDAGIDVFDEEHRSNRYPSKDDLKADASYISNVIGHYAPLNFSQRMAVLSAKRQNTFVSGSAGTGKSEVILNLVYDRTMAGKTSLVCSEKKIALEVITKRLGKHQILSMDLTDLTNSNLIYGRIRDLYDCLDQVELEHVEPDEAFIDKTTGKVVIPTPEKYFFNTEIGKKYVDADYDLKVTFLNDCDKYNGIVRNPETGEIIKTDPNKAFSKELTMMLDVTNPLPSDVITTLATLKDRYQFKSVVDVLDAVNSCDVFVKKRKIAYADLPKYIEYRNLLKHTSNPIDTIKRYQQDSNRNSRNDRDVAVALSRYLDNTTADETVLKDETYFADRSAMVEQFKQNYDITNLLPLFVDVLHGSMVAKSQLDKRQNRFAFLKQQKIEKETINAFNQVRAEIGNDRLFVDLLDRPDNVKILTDVNNIRNYNFSFLAKDQIAENLLAAFKQNVMFFDEKTLNLLKNVNLNDREFEAQRIRSDGELNNQITTRYQDRWNELRQIQTEFERYTSDGLDNVYFGRIRKMIQYEFTDTELKRAKKMFGLAQYEKESERPDVTLFLRSYFDILLKLFPIWLGTPENIATVIPLNLDPDQKPAFDYGIFDEASQLKMEKAIPILYRSDIHIILGDEKQLKPTEFFNRKSTISRRLINGGDLDVANSLLDRCRAALYTKIVLTNHYRSRHSTLVEFNNKYIYNGGLLFASYNGVKDGMSVVNVENAVYKDQTNLAEATTIAAEVWPLLPAFATENNKRLRLTTTMPYTSNDAHSPKTILIITMNLKQAEAVKNELKKLDQQNNSNSYEKAVFSGWLSIKSLENVQGDEADIVYISLGIAPNPDGKISSNLGFIGRDGGKYRLNVMTSRAKDKMVVVKSITADQLNVRIENENAMIFSQFVDYCDKLAQKQAAKLETETSEPANTEQEKLVEILSQTPKKQNETLLTNVVCGNNTITAAFYDNGNGMINRGLVMNDVFKDGNYSNLIQMFDRVDFLNNRNYPVNFLTPASLLDENYVTNLISDRHLKRLIK